MENTNDIKKILSELEFRHDVARLLGISDRQLRYLLYSKRYKKYKEIEIKKKMGGVRLIHSPHHALKKLQRSLNNILVQVYQPKRSTYGFVSGKSIIKNAEKHLRQRCILNIDLKDFFPSINFGRVQGLFKAAPYNLSHNVSTVLAEICCYEYEVDDQLNRRLPQGAPTSPVVSNMICAKLDSQLQRLATIYKCIYTRYVDDITFSTSRSKFPPSLAFFSEKDDKWILGKELLEVIEGNGFFVNERKIRLATKHQRQEVTGITVNKFLNVKRHYVRQIRAMLHSWKTEGLAKAESTFLEKFDKKNRLDPSKVSFPHVVQGKIEFLGAVKGKSDLIYLKFIDQLRVLAPELVSDYHSQSSPVVKASIITEGKTDVYHLKAAFKSLQEQGFFPSLDIDIRDQSASGNEGDESLKNFCASLRILSNNEPVIAIFDRDAPKTLSQVHDELQGFKRWSDGVYSFAIPVPTHRRSHPEICIEFYYSDEEIKQIDPDGRRLFISTEFNQRTWRHSEDKKLSTTNHNYVKSPFPKIIDKDVHDDSDNNVALSKNNFANNIFQSQPGFDKFDFSAFSAIFEVIEKILQIHSSR
jgi:RNA-directed DNA polymerase